MLDDAFFNVEAWINSELATEFAEQEEIAFTLRQWHQEAERVPGV